ncbi:hypothetical protein CBL_00809 [Carabus blaptoides fortunei]
MLEVSYIVDRKACTQCRIERKAFVSGKRATTASMCKSCTKSYLMRTECTVPYGPHTQALLIGDRRLQRDSGTLPVRTGSAANVPKSTRTVMVEFGGAFSTRAPLPTLLPT